MEKITFRSNSKEVIEKVRNHILEYYELDDLRNDIKSLKYSNESTYQTARKLVENGCFLVYYTDVREFLDSLNLNNKSNKTFTDEECWKMYIHLLAREIEKIVS